MTDPLFWLHFIEANYTVIRNWAVLPYTERRVSHTTPDIWIHRLICPDQGCVVEIQVDWDKATRLTVLHQHKTFPSGRNASVRVDALRQSRQRQPGGGLLSA